MTTPTKAVAKTTESQVEYIPLGGDETSRVKLSISIVKHYFAVPTKSGKLPSDRDCVRFMLLCKSRALSPAEGDAFLLGYDGKNGPEFSLITAHQAFLKRAEIHPEFDGLESGVIVKDAGGAIVERIGDFVEDEDELLGGWAVVHFKTRKHPRKERLRLSTFNKGFGRWQVDAAGMIVKTAEASALRTSFPTKIGGLYLRDEVDVKADGPTLTGSGEMEIPTVTVEPVTERVEQKPEIQEQPEEEKEDSRLAGPQQDLADIVTGAGFTFSDFQAWAEESGNLDSAQSLPGFEAVPTAVAERLKRAKTGLVTGLRKFKDLAL